MSVSVAADEARITGSAWQMGYAGEAFFPGVMRFLAGGALSSHHDHDRIGWRHVDGCLVILAPGGEVTVTLDRVGVIGDVLQLEGDCRSSWSAGRTLVLREFVRDGAHHAALPINAEATPGHLRSNLRELIDRFGWDIGDHSYGHPIIFESSLARLTVGRFVSIAGNVCLALGNHRTDTATTYPFSALQHIWPLAPTSASHTTRGDIVIGNDVWIGAFAFVTAGVTIGDGAVVGGNAVVTRSVPPYAVVAGNPARIVRFRFDARTIVRLLDLRWWDWDDRIIAVMLPRIMQPDVRAFLGYCDANPHELRMPEPVVRPGPDGAAAEGPTASR